MQAVDLGTGTTITFGTSGFSAEITNISHDGINREIIETSHLGTSPAGANEIGSKTFLAGDLSDPGELTLEGHFDGDDIPPVEGAPETVTVTFPLGSGETTPTTWQFSGQMTGFSYNVPLEDKITFTATVKAVGPVTRTAAT